MKRSGLEKFGAYQKALQLFDLVVRDMAPLRSDPRCYRLVSQQVASADSICANIEEGYGRLSRKEYVRFLDFSRASARETQGRYRRMKHWLEPEVIEQRTDLADEIISILTTSIERLRRYPQRGKDARSHVAEDSFEYDCIEPPSTLDTRHSTLDDRLNKTTQELTDELPVR